MKTLHAYTASSGCSYPEYVNVSRDVATDRICIMVRGPAVNGREGPFAQMSMDAAEAIALGRRILSEFDAEYAP